MIFCPSDRAARGQGPQVAGVVGRAEQAHEVEGDVQGEDSPAGGHCEATTAARTCSQDGRLPAGR